MGQQVMSTQMAAPPQQMAPAQQIQQMIPAQQIQQMIPASQMIPAQQVAPQHLLPAQQFAGSFMAQPQSYTILPSQPRHTSVSVPVVRVQDQPAPMAGQLTIVADRVVGGTVAARVIH